MQASRWRNEEGGKGNDLYLERKSKTLIGTWRKMKFPGREQSTRGGCSRDIIAPFLLSNWGVSPTITHFADPVGGGGMVITDFNEWHRKREIEL